MECVLLGLVVNSSSYARNLL